MINCRKPQGIFAVVESMFRRRTRRDASTEEVGLHSAPLRATDSFIQLFPDADASLRRLARRRGLKQTRKAGGKDKGATDDIKAAEWHDTQGVHVDELITDV